MAPRVLVVDDDSACRAAALAALAGRGYATLAAASAREAYTRIRAGQVDGLVVSHPLPDAPGLKLCARLRHDGFRLPIVLTSAPADVALETRARAQLGLTAWLPAAAGPDAAASALAAVLRVPPPAAWHAGALAPFVLARVLFAAWAAGATGTLHLGRGDERRGIELLAGEPVSLVPASPQALVESLAADGRIAPEEARAYARRPEPSLLVKMGVLDLPELVELERALLEQGLATLLGWDSGRFVFKAGPVALAAPPPRLALPRFLYAWVRAARLPGSDEDLVQRAAGRIIAPTARFFDALPFLEPGPVDAPVLAALEASGVGAEPEALVADPGGWPGGPGARDERASCLDALYSLGLVEVLDAPHAEPPLPDYPRRTMGPRLVPEQLEGVVDDGFVDLSSELAGEVAGALAGLAVPPADRPAPSTASDAERAERETALREEHRAIAERNYYEVFGLTPATYRYEAVKEAYFAKLKRFTPDFFVQHGSNGEIVSMAEEVVARLAAAYNTLSNVVAKENYDRLLAERGPTPTGDREEDALQAQVQLQSGEAFLAQGDFEAAERALVSASTLAPRPETLAHLAWAIFKNPRNARSRAAALRALGLLAKSLSLEPTADAFAYRGSIFLADGKVGLAEIELQKALRLSPRHRHATRELAALEERRAQEEKGFFRRLFT